MRFLPDRDDLSVAVIGVGYVGSCVAATLAELGCDVVGVDSDEALVEELNAGVCRLREPGLSVALRIGLESGRLTVTTDMAQVRAADVVLITVGTPVRSDGSLVDEHLRVAMAEVSDQLQPGQLVVLKSTVPPGTTRDLVRSALEVSGLVAGRDFGLAFSPERLAEGTALHELRTLPMVTSGLTADCRAAVDDLWRRTLGVAVLPMDTLEAAELVKLASNWWIDLNIALANELAKLCGNFGADVMDVISATNSIPKGAGTVNILFPSVGVGGSCLTKDPRMVWRAGQQHGTEIQTAVASRRVNDGMPGYTAGLILDELARSGKEPAESTVAVLGLAFKNNTGDMRETPVLGVVEALSEAGVVVRCYDPLVDQRLAAQKVGGPLAKSVEEATVAADCIAVLAHHSEFKAIDYGALSVADPCIFLDGRAYLSKERISQMESLGYRYRGIGRGAIPVAPSGARSGPKSSGAQAVA